MRIWQITVVLCVLVALSCGDSHHHKHKCKKHHHLYWHGLHYLTFLALKFKVLLVIGSIFTVGILAGKIFAVLKFAEYMKKSYIHDDHHEKLYINPHDYPRASGFSAPGGSVYPVGDGGHQESFPPGFTLDQPPPNAPIVGSGGDFNGGPNQIYGSGPGQAYGGNQPYGRSIDTMENNFYRNVDMFIKKVKRMNITEMVFDDMNLKTEDCRKKFVCEADYNAKGSILLRSALNFLKDDSYAKYKTNKIITAIDECAKLYPNCQEST